MEKQRHPRGPEVSVNVTQDIISISTRAHSSHCMIAEAIKAAVPTAKYVSVDISTCRFTDIERGYRYVYLTPRTAQIALVGFDEGLAPEPFTFKLRGAHVLAAGKKQIRGTGAKAVGKPKQSASQKRALAKARAARLGRASIVISQTDGIRRVGGKLPPQLHVRREFGMRAFRAATDNRLAAPDVSASATIEGSS